MNLLAVETSGFEASIAFAQSGQLQETRFLPTEGRRHAQTLVSHVQALLQHHHVRSSEVDVVAVSVGPGSFTGLRVGVVFAKTFAFANQAQLVAVDTLQAIAQRCIDRHSSERICVISDAQRQEVFLNCYQLQGSIFASSQSPEIVPAAHMSKQGEDLLWSGPGILKFRNDLNGCRLVSDELSGPSAGTVAQIGCHMAENQKFDSVARLEPVYLRRSYAEENAARR